MQKPNARHGHIGFNTAERKLWRDEMFGDLVLGYLKTHKHLTHLIIRNAGHMVSLVTQCVWGNTVRVLCLCIGIKRPAAKLLLPHTCALPQVAIPTRALHDPQTEFFRLL